MNCRKCKGCEIPPKVLIDRFASKRIALIGNPNCGKTTLFNLLTKSHQYVGNWPGVTVDRVEGHVEDYNYAIVDLPGLYALSPYSAEELVSRNYLLSDEYDVILNIVDASHLERSLSLTLELASFNKPMVIALNMMDVIAKQGISIDVKALENALGVPVVTMSASKKKGEKELLKTITKARVPDIEKYYDKNVIRIIDSVANMITDEKSLFSRRFIATSLLQSDEVYLEEHESNQEIMDSVKQGIKELEEYTKTDCQAYFAQARYDAIDSIVDSCKKKQESGHSDITKAIDSVVLNRILALPIFFIVVGFVYFGAMYFTSYLELIPHIADGETESLTITDYVNDVVFGEYVSAIVENMLTAVSSPDWLVSLMVDGVVGGVGAVLGFLPQIACLFIFLSFLEQSGYMTRVAFILDRIFRSFGLSGKNFIPLVIATGCGVPALMANATIDNINEKRIGLITTTFIPCSAKLPIMTMIFASVMNNAWWFAPFVYAMSIFSIVCTGIILKKSNAFNESVSPFVMEIPDYHMPSVFSVLKEVYSRCKAFVIKAGTVIFLVVVLVWLLSNTGVENKNIGFIENIDNSFLAMIGGLIAFLFAPIGFGSWQSAVAMVNGFLAKENVVSTMAVVLGLSENTLEEDQSLSQALVSFFARINGCDENSYLLPIIGLSFLSFCLWSTPCVAALGAMKRQLGSNRWFLFAIFYLTAWAYGISLVIYQLFGYMYGVVPFNTFTVIAIAVLLLFIVLLIRPSKHKGVSLSIPSKRID